MEPVQTIKKVALVTGGSRGLGRAICRKLSREGYTVVVNYRSSRDEAEMVAQEAGGASFPFHADVGSARQVDEMFAAVDQRLGRIDAVVCNAGITHDRLLLRQTESEWDEVIRTNLTGCFHVIRAAAPLMIRAGGGHIVAISSYSGLRGKAGQAAYSASKAGIFGLVATAAQELGPENIRVNAVLPGYLPSGMGAASSAAMENARGTSIMKTLSDVDEAASFVAHLLAMKIVTGQVFSLDSRVS